MVGALDAPVAGDIRQPICICGEVRLRGPAARVSGSRETLRSRARFEMQIEKRNVYCEEERNVYCMGC